MGLDLLNQKQVRERLGGLPPSSFYALHQSGEFPPPDTTIGRGVRWLASTIDRYIEKRVELTKQETAAE